MPKFIALLFLAVVAIAQPANAPTVALTATDRAVIIETLRQYATAEGLWSIYYSYDDRDRAYYAGLADGLRMSASFLEVYRPSPQYPPNPSLR